MEEPRIPRTEEGEAEPQREKEHAHHFFSTFEGLCTMNLSPKARPWTPSSTAMFFAVRGRISSKTTWTVVRGQLAAPWWQCTLSPSSRNAWVSRPQRQITLPQPPYSPDLAPCDFFIFPKMKLQLKGCPVDRVEEIQRESQNVLGTLREQDFQHAFQQWKRRWDRCVTAQGDYFEGALPKLKIK